MERIFKAWVESVVQSYGKATATAKASLENFVRYPWQASDPQTSEIKGESDLLGCRNPNGDPKELKPTDEENDLCPDVDEEFDNVQVLLSVNVVQIDRSKELVFPRCTQHSWIE